MVLAVDLQAKIGGIPKTSVLIEKGKAMSRHRAYNKTSEASGSRKEGSQLLMATMDSAPPEPETDGVNAALERVRTLESRIRQAIQMNNRDLERPDEVVDRERSALDSIE